jgi:hypothetical protein
MNTRGGICVLLTLSLGLVILIGSASQSADKPTEGMPLLVLTEQKEVHVFGQIFPARFNAAKGPEAQYHFLVWQGGTSPGALIETPVDDLDFHDALLGLGAQPGNNLTMTAWTKRHDHDNPAPRQTITGSQLQVRISWRDKPNGLPIDQVFQHSALRPQPSALNSHSVLSPQSSVLNPRFSGNRDRWFNTIPFVPRPGCLMCLYSCPSGKVGNGVLSIADYVHKPQHFQADTDQLPPDGTAVIVTFQLQL